MNRNLLFSEGINRNATVAKKYMRELTTSSCWVRDMIVCSYKSSRVAACTATNHEISHEWYMSTINVAQVQSHANSHVNETSC